MTTAESDSSTNQTVEQPTESSPEVGDTNANGCLEGSLTAGAIIGGLCLYVAGNVIYVVGHNDGVREAQGLNSSPPATVVEPDPTCVDTSTSKLNFGEAEDVAEAVAEKKFAMDVNQLDVLRGRLYEAQDYEGVQTVMNDVFNSYGVDVVVADLPPEVKEDSETAAAKMTHDLTQLDLELAQVSSYNILKYMLRLQDDMLHRMQGTTMYLSAGLMVDGNAVTANSYTFSEDNKALIIGMGMTDPTANSFAWGLSLELYRQMCPGVAHDKDAEFLDLNREGFNYTNYVDQQAKAVNNDDVFSATAAQSPYADEVMNIQDLLKNGMHTQAGNCAEEVSTPTCEKRRKTAERFMAIFPDYEPVIAFQTDWPTDDPKRAAEMYVSSQPA